MRTKYPFDIAKKKYQILCFENNGDNMTTTNKTKKILAEENELLKIKIHEQERRSGKKN